MEEIMKHKPEKVMDGRVGVVLLNDKKKRRITIKIILLQPV